MIVPSRSTSGFVDVTCPDVRCGSGVVNTSSVGRFGKWRRPSTVVKSAAHQVCVGSMPTVSSVPGPRSSNASKRRSARRCAESFSVAMRSSQAAGRVGLVEPQHVLELAPQLLVRLLLGQVGVDERAPRPDAGTGGCTSSCCARRRSCPSPSARAAGPCRRATRRGRRAGSARSARRARRARPSPPACASMRSPYHCGTYSSVSGSAFSTRARFRCGSKYQTSTNCAPRS